MLEREEEREVRVRMAITILMLEQVLVFPSNIPSSSGRGITIRSVVKVIKCYIDKVMYRQKTILLST